MLKFKTLSLEDKAWVDELVMQENSRAAGYNFGNIYIWNRNYWHLVAVHEGRMITKQRYSEVTSFVYPVGGGELKGAVEATKVYAHSKGWPLVFRGITESQMQQLEEAFPGCFQFTEDVDYADYIYLAEKLASYSGKALHGKKNHCNRFEANHSWEFRPITRELIPGCLDMLDRWTEDNMERLHRSIVYEHEAILKAFAAYEKLGLEGGVLIADGNIVGFSMGEFTSRDCFVVHFEKADRSIQGAYPMVCRELCRQLMAAHPELVYINREEDMGFESLRKSKQSYKPVMMLRKFTARWKDE